MKHQGAIGNNAQFMRPCNSNSQEPNFTKLSHEGSIDIVVIPVVLVFSRNSTQWPSEGGGMECEFLRQKLDVLGPQQFFCG